MSSDDHDDDLPGYENPELGWLPMTGCDQSCAICDDPAVVWLHPLARDKVEYREYGKRYTLPTFWTLCQRCEDLYATGADYELVGLMRRSGGGTTDRLPKAYVDEVYGQPLAVFRRADLGARRFGEVP